MLKIFRSKSRREYDAYQQHIQENFKIASHLLELYLAERKLEKEMLEKLGEEEFAVWKRQREEEQEQAYYAAWRAEMAEECRPLEEQPEPERWAHKWARAFGPLIKLIGMS